MKKPFIDVKYFKTMSVDEILTLKYKALEMLVNNYSLRMIENKLMISSICLQDLLIYKVPDQVKIGHKDEPYYENEDQMMNYPTYDYKSLSSVEKDIFISKLIEK